MDRLLQEKVIMYTCPVCHSNESRRELIDEVFRVDGHYFPVSGIPAVVCIRCGEHAISRETAEQVRLTVHGGAEATRTVSMRVFKYA